MSDFPIDLLNKCRKDTLRPENATLLKNQEAVFVPLTTDAELLVAFPDGGLDMGAAEVAFLEKYTWATNDDASMFVDDPVIGREAFYGRWRQAFVRRVTLNDQPLIVISLRRGFITTLLNKGSIDYSEARMEMLKDAPAGALAGVDGGNTTSDYLVIKFAGVSPAAVKQIKDELSGVDANTFAPSIKGEAYGSNWHMLYVQDRVEVDGTASILLYLARPEYSLKGYQMWSTERKVDVEYHWNVPRSIAQTLIDGWKSKGHSATASYNSNDELVDIILSNNIGDSGYFREETDITKQTTTYTSQYWNVYDPAAYAIPATHVTGYTYQKDTKSNGDGTYDTTVRETLAKPTVTEFVAAASPFSHTYVITYQNSEDKIEAGVTPDSGEYRTNQQVNQFGLYDGTLSYEMASDGISAAFKSEDTAQAEEYSYLYRRNAVAISAPEAPDGTIYQADNNLRDDGTYDAKLSERTAKAYVAQFDSAVTAFRVESMISYQNSPDMISAPAYVTGSGEYRVSQQRNQFGRFDGALQYAYGTDSGEVGFESMNGSLDEAYTYIYKTRNSEVQAPVSEVGKVWQADNNLNPDGTYDAKVVLQKSVASYLEHQSVKTAFKEGSTVIAKNTTDVPSGLNVTGSSGIYRVNAGINRDGTYDYVMSYEYGNNKGEAEFASTRSALEDRNSVVYKSRAAQVEAPASGVGYIYQADNSLGDDGTYDARLTYAASVPAVVEHQSVVTAFKDGRSIIAKNATVMPDGLTMTGAGAYRISSTINQDGTYDYSLSYEHGTNSGEAEFSSTDSALEKRSTVLYKSVDTQVDAPSSSVGYIYQSDNSLGEDGTYDARLTYSASVAASVEHQSVATSFRTGTTIIAKNQIILPANLVMTGSGAYRISSNINQDGTYDYSLSYEYGTNAGSASFISANSALDTQSAVLYKSANDQVDAPASATGYTYRADNNLNDDGTYDSRLAYAASIAASVEHQSVATAFRTGSTIVAKNQTTLPSGLSITGPGVYRISSAINNDGTYDYNLSYEYGTNTGQAEFSSLSSALEERAAMLYKSSNDVVQAPASAAGYVYQADNNLNDDGTYDARLTYSASIPASLEHQSVVTAFRAGSSVVAKNVVSVPSGLTITGPGIYRVSSGINGDGTYDYNLSYEYGTNSGEASFLNVYSETLERTAVIYKSRDTQVDAPASGQGATYQVDNTLNDDGTYDSRLSYSKSKPVSATAYSVRTSFRDGTQVIASNSPTVPTVPTVTGDGVYRLSFGINDDATYNYNLQYEKGTSSGGAEFDSAKASTAVEASVIYRNSATKLDAPASGQGYTYRADNSLTDEGTYNSRLVYQASIANSFEMVTTATPFATETIYRVTNNDTLPSITAPTSGSYQATARMNENGTFDYDIVYKQGNAIGSYGFDSGVSYRAYEYTSIGVGSTVAIAVPAPDTRHTYRANNELREDGLYNTRLTDSCSKSQEMLDVASSDSAVETAYTSLYINADVPTQAPAAVAGVTYAAQNDINDDGTYNTTVRSSMAKAGAGVIDIQSVNTELEGAYRMSLQGAATPISAPSRTQGSVYSVSNQARQDGLFDYAVDYTKSIPFMMETSITDGKGTSSIYIYRNQTTFPTPAGLPTSGPNGEVYNNTISANVNTDGTYDVAISSSPSSTSGNTETSWPQAMEYVAAYDWDRSSHTIDGEWKPMRRKVLMWKAVGTRRTHDAALKKIHGGLNWGEHHSEVVSRSDKVHIFSWIYVINLYGWEDDGLIAPLLNVGAP